MGIDLVECVSIVLCFCNDLLCIGVGVVDWCLCVWFCGSYFFECIDDGFGWVGLFDGYVLDWYIGFIVVEDCLYLLVDFCFDVVLVWIDGGI